MDASGFTKGIMCLGASVLLGLAGCSDDTSGGSGTSDSDPTESSTATDSDSDSDSAGSETSDSNAGDGDGDTAGDSDGDTAGDGDGDGDGDSGDGDGDPATGDGDGDSGDGDGDTGDGDGDTGDGDGDPMQDVCGDGMVTGDEVCDDGVNDGAYGGCAQDCMALAPFCGDSEVNGPETCDDGDNGELDDGCLPGCEVPWSCLDIYEFDDTALDGVYMIQPEALDAPFSVSCDMTNGGWTLAMRFAPSDSELHFFSPHWTEVSLLNEGEVDPEAPEDGKFASFDYVIGSEIRGCLQNPDDQLYGCKAYDMPDTTTLLDMFTSIPIGSDVEMEGLFFDEDQDAKLEWLSIQGRNLNEASVNPGYIATGINIDDDQSCYDAKIRFGLVLNNEVTIFTLNDAAGFGAQSYYTAGCDIEGQDSPWATAAGFAAGPNVYQTAGQIWVR